VTDTEAGFDFQVVTPNRIVLKERVTSLMVPGARGSLGFWARHAPMLVALAPGVVRFRPAGTPGVPFQLLAVGGGFYEFSPDGRATLLADTAELPAEIDVDRAMAAYQRARRRLSRPTPKVDISRAELALERALARLRAAGKS